MRYFLILSLIFLISTPNVFAQDFSKLPTYEIKENSDFSYLEPILKDKRLVMLGEMTHGDGATFLLKTNVIKYLHEELGYNVLALEDGMYDFLKWRNERKNGETTFDAIYETMPYQWSKAKEMQNLFDYLKSHPELVFTGFDSSGALSDELLYEIDSIAGGLGIKVYGGFPEDFQVLKEHRGSKRPNKSRVEMFQKTLRLISDSLSTLDCKNCDFWIHTIDGLRIQANAWWDFSDDSKRSWWNQNCRDSAMARNVSWLLNEKFAGEKMIIWAANFHVAKDVSNIPSSKYFRVEETQTMADYLEPQLEDNMYSIGTISYTGEYLISGENRIQKIREKPKRSIEYDLEDKYENAFIDFSASKDFGKFNMSGIVHYLSQKTDWTLNFDGVLFIKKMTPSTIIR